MNIDVLEIENIEEYDDEYELFIRTINSYQNPENSDSDAGIEPYTNSTRNSTRNSNRNSNNTLNICNICFEEHTNFYKICECPNSRICNECLAGMNLNQLIRCPLCRRELTTETVREARRNNIMMKYLIMLFLILMVECIIPIIYFSCDSPNDTYKSTSKYSNWISEDNNIIIIIILSVIVFQPLYFIISSALDNTHIYFCITNQKIYIKIAFWWNLLIEIILFNVSPVNVAINYFLIISFPLYYMPPIITFVFITINYLKILYKNCTPIRSARIVPITTTT